MAIAQTPLSKGFCYFRLWFHSNAAEQLKLEQAGFLSIFCLVAGFSLAKSEAPLQWVT